MSESKLQNRFRFLASFFLIIFSIVDLDAAVRVGSGVSSFTSGRSSPVLFAGLESDKLGMTLSSVGTNSALSYYTAIQSSIFGIYRPGKLLWGTMDAGLGWGFFYYQFGYRDNPEHSGRKRTGYVTGPSMRVNWNFLPFMYLGVETIFGLSFRYPFNHLTLNSQDCTVMSLGVVW